nr:MAG TPA: hypothetical protein [Bacteriophage sp.]
MAPISISLAFLAAYLVRFELASLTNVSASFAN